MIVKFQNREFFLGILIIILITDISVLLDVPLFRQIFGFLFLSLIPGIIILRGLKLNSIGTANTFVFGVGLSVLFTMGFGLLLTTILPFLGYESPLSTISLIIFFSILEIILLVIVNRQEPQEGFTIKIPIFNKIDKICLIIAFSVPIFSMIGIYFMNQFDENLLLLSLFFLIAFLIGFMALKNNALSSNLYPLLIFIISISLIFIFPLRSSHILGVDTHVEYYYFQYTFNHLRWTILEHGLLDACLSISLLPSVYTSLSGLNPEFLFRIYSPLLFSISPIIVYLIAKKYIDPYYAFLAAIFFMSQSGFMVTESLARTNIAIIFISLIILSLFSDNIDRFNKGFLIISFLLGCIFSHYSSSYIFFLMLFITCIITYLLSMKYRVIRNLNFFTIVIFFCALFFWFSIVIEGPFTIGVQFIEQIFDFGKGVWSPELAQLSGQNLSVPFVSAINLFIKWLTFCFIGYGVLVGAIFWVKQTQKIPMNQIESPLGMLDIEFIILGFISGIILCLTVFLPVISVGYDIQRIFLLISVVLSSFFMIGGIIIIKQLNLIFKKFIKKEKSMILKVLSPTCVMTCLVILNFLFSMGIPHQFVGENLSIFFNSEGDLYNRMYIHDQDSSGATWIKELRDKNLDIYSDVYGEKVLQSQSEILYTSRIPEISSGSVFEKGYLFTIYYNNINKKFFNTMNYPLDDNLAPKHDEIVKDLNKVYTNKGSEIWTI